MKARSGQALLESLNIELMGLVAQFRGLRGRHPGLWPVVPRWCVFVAIGLAIQLIGWVLQGQDDWQALESAQASEQQLRAEVLGKLRLAGSLEALRAQKLEVMRRVHRVEQQLPNRAQMDALLTEINQAGVGRGLQFELFKPAAVILREAYAEMPIALRVVGRYDDIGAFASDLSRMPRIVTLHNLNLQVLEARPPAATGAPGTLILEAVIKTFRLLEDDEQSAQQRALEKRRTDTAGPT